MLKNAGKEEVEGGATDRREGKDETHLGFGVTPLGHEDGEKIGNRVVEKTPEKNHEGGYKKEAFTFGELRQT